MKKTGIIILLGLLCQVVTLQANSEWINIKEKGAGADGQTLATTYIQNAIDEAAIAGGGVIYFPAGTYLTGAIHLKSNITLHLDAGAVLRFSDNPADYLPFVDLRWEGVMMKSFSPLIHAEGADNIAIEGRGLLDGQGQAWWNRILEKISEIKKDGDIKNIGEYEKMWEESNKGLEVSDYYKKTLKRRFFRPPFFQANHCTNIRITGVKFINSPFWTINPIFCDNIIIDGITINNPKSPNTDGINPSSCSNVHISNCHLNVGDDCITIKSGRDKQGRDLAVPCQNITITNCTMLAGHGGVVIGSEMSGDVRKVTISNCVFDGTERGIRLKSSRERGGIVEEIRVSNIVMKNIQREAFMFNLYYDKSLPEGPVTEKTPVFRNIHISNVTGSEVKQACKIIGIPESPIENISFSDINIDAEKGFDITTAKNIELHNVTVNTSEGSAFKVQLTEKLVFENVKTNTPHDSIPVIEIQNVKDCYLFNCFQLIPTNMFLWVNGSNTQNINLWSNQFSNISEAVQIKDCDKTQIKIQ